MKKIYFFASLLILVVALSSCEKEKAAETYSIPVNYTNWTQPLKPLTYPVPGHGKSKRVIFVNQTGKDARILTDENGKKQVSYRSGTVIIKEVYKETEMGYVTDPQLTIMVKNPAHEKARNGWLYYVKNADQGQPVMIENKLCHGCHDAANERHLYFDKNEEGIFRDFVFLDLAK